MKGGVVMYKVDSWPPFASIAYYQPFFVAQTCAPGFIRGFRLPGRVSSSTEKFPALKALTSLKTVRIEMVWGPYLPHNS